MSLCMKQSNPGHREQTPARGEQTPGFQGGGGWERDGLGAWGWQMQTVRYKMDKPGPIVQHRELYSIS